MADITVRKLRLSFDSPDQIDLDVPDADFPMALSALAISLTMPYLEPYLIRSMKGAIDRIDDPALAEDVRLFSQQEGHHYRNHIKVNERVRERFSAPVATELGEIETALEADYQRFTREEPLRFNLAYAEGFEALTCGVALAAAEHRSFERIPGQDLFTWHMAEEIEHRSVAFDVFEHLVGSYYYRLRAGCWSQWHYLPAVDGFIKTMARALDRKVALSWRPIERSIVRNYLRTLSPRYDPAKIAMPAGVDALLEAYTQRAAHG